VMTRTTRSLVAAFVTVASLCFAASGWSTNGYGKLSGVVLDPSGTPQMGATVWLSPETIGDATAQLLTNQSGIFGSARLRPGLYSVRVTLAGFLPAVQEHVRIQADLTTLVGVQLQSVLTSFDQLRRPAPQPNETDDWKWVLRSASATRPILQWRGSASARTVSSDVLQPRQPHVRVEMTTGGHPAGSLSNSAMAPATSVSYDQPIGGAGRLLLAGQMSYAPSDVNGSGVSMASIWVPSGEFDHGPETTFVMRQQVLRGAGLTVRQMRAEHSERIKLGDRLAVEYGAEYLAADGPHSSASSLRPRTRIIMQVSPRWLAAFSVETEPGAYALDRRDSSLVSALDALDTLPMRVWHNGQSTIAGGWHEELAMRRDVGANGNLELATFHDFSGHQAVYGFDKSSQCDLPEQQYCSSTAYEHDAGAGGSWGTRVVYRQKISSNLQVAAIYAWAGALTPPANANDSSAPANLEGRLQTKYRHSLAARVSGKVPRTATQVTASYKWINGPVVGRQDAFGESALGVDPNLSFSVRQPIPLFLSSGHWEALVDVRNVLSQGYVSMANQDGQTVFVPVLRSFRGGLSFQF
jgi:hypothetical protein